MGTPSAARHWPPAWTAPLLLVLAFAAGFASDAFTAQGRINLLPPSLLGLFAWNLAVYLWLAAAWLRGRERPGAVRRALAQLLRRLAPRDAPPVDAAERARGAARLLVARFAALLHAGALGWALGALASIYWHGIFLEYLAGWSSTFIRDPATLRALLSVLLWPATALAGVTLPDAPALDALRFSVGPGENAARWIHWYALSTLCVVVLPRGLLALGAAWQARRLAANSATPATTAPPRARLLPYSYQLAAPLQAGLRSLLHGAFGPQLELRIDAPVAQGSEDEPERWLGMPANGDETLVLLFALTATPEAETHGAFLAAVAAGQGKATRRLVLIDESGFRARFADEARIAQRRAAWQRLLAAHGERAAFVDLARPRPADLEAALA